MDNVTNDFIKRILQNKKLKITLISVIVIFITVIGFSVYLTSSKTENISETEILIYPNDNITKVKEQLIAKGVISKSNTSFSTFAKTLKYSQNIKSGRYIIKAKTPIIKLVRLLRSGNQQPVKVVITTARTTEDFAEKITKKLLITKEDLLKEIKKQGYKYDNELFEYVIPNTYEVFWNTSAENLLEKLRKESDKFWDNNKEKLQLTNLSKKEVVVLASIVSEETAKRDEMPRIAGVYINRLNKNMLLQADPTVKFAVGDFSLRRITGKHLQIDSEFNTYKNLGLPPAPICLPNVNALKAVLKYEKHNYIFFCAKEDFSGYHNFAATHDEHLKNAVRYRQALNAKNIH